MEKTLYLQLHIELESIKVEGISGRFDTIKEIWVNEFESVDFAITLIHKLLKKHTCNATITFDSWDGYRTIGYGRVFGNYDGTYSLVEWSNNGNAKDTTENITLTRKAIKENVIHFIQRFKEDLEAIKNGD